MPCLQELVEEHRVQLPGRWSLDNHTTAIKTLTSAMPLLENAKNLEALCTASFVYTLHRFSMQDIIGIVCWLPHRETSDVGCSVKMVKVDFDSATTIGDIISDMEVLMTASGVEDDDKCQSNGKFKPLSNVGISFLPPDGSSHAHAEQEDCAGIVDVFLTVSGDREKKLECQLKYLSNRIDEEIAMSLRDAFLVVLKESMANPLSPLSSIRLSTKVPLYLVQLNDTSADYPHTKTVHECFDQIVAKYPNRIALEDSKMRQVSYRKLQGLSNSIAESLYNSGVRPGESLGFMVSRSISCITSFIATLRLSCCYVYLNTCLPNERLKYQAEMCSITHVLCDTEGAQCLLMDNLFPNANKDTSVCFEGLMLYTINPVCNGGGNPHASITMDQKPPRHSTYDYRSPCVSSDTLAYTMFTSGTTGVPKGVDISHRNIVNFATNFNEINHQDETGLLHSPLSFDATTVEIWSILLNGGKLVIAPPTRMSPEDIVNFVVERKVTQLFLTTGLFHVVIAHHCHTLQTVRHIIVCGDVMVPEWARQAVTKLKSTAIYNNYGPTETTVFCTVYKIPKEFGKINMEFVPIGKLMKNYKMYFLDSQLNPVPFGVPGDLYIGGDSVGIGYKNNANSQAFIRPPEWIEESGLVYKSGDTARCIPDPFDKSKVIVQYLGRTDTQTKIEGVRIELKDCESWILKHPLVKDVSVIARGDSADKRKLEAYVVLTESVSVSVLRQYSMKHLPRYGVPSMWYAVNAIPLDNNGKVSRRDLPKLQGAKPTISFKVAPMERKTKISKDEQILARIWSDEIQVPLESINLATNYFEIGGTSLIALHIMARITREMNRKISRPALLFYKPIFGEFAEDVLSSATTVETGSTMSLQRSSFDPCLLSWQQQGFYDIGKLKIDTRADKIYAAVKFPSKLNPELLEESINRVIMKNSILHTLYGEVDSKPYKVQSKMLCQIALTKRSLTGFRIEDSPVIIAADSGKDIDFVRGPLMKCTLYEFDNSKNSVLNIIAHHIAIDDFALWNLIRNILAYYENQRDSIRGNAASVSYDDFVDEQQKEQHQSFTDAQSFWESRTKNSSLNPFGISEVKVKANVSNQVITSLPIRLSKPDVAAISQEHGVSHMCVLLAAYYLALCDITGKQVISIASPFANRNVETLAMIGSTANRVILKLDALTRPSITTAELLHSVTQEILSCMEYQHLPVRCAVPLVGFNYFSTENYLLPLSGQALYVPVANSPNDHFVWMEVTEFRDGIYGNIQYNSNILSSNAMHDLSGRFVSHLIGFKVNDKGFIQHRQQLANTESGVPAVSEIESILLQEKQITECHVMQIEVNSDTKLCAYIKTNAAFQDTKTICSKRLHSHGFYGVLISLVVNIPRNVYGDVDEGLLSKCHVVDDNSCKTIKEHLSRIYSTPDVGVTCIKRPSEDLTGLPVVSDRIDVGTNLQEFSSRQINNYEDYRTADGSVSKSWNCNVSGEQVYDTIVDSTAVDDSTREVPDTMIDALFATARKFPNKGMHFISHEQMKVVLSYHQMLQEALKVSAGLQAKNVKAGDFIILHDDSTRTMLPVWWGSVLLGAIAVFVTTSSTYKQITGVTDKLHHVWSLLKRPVIICSGNHESNIQAMESLYDDFHANVIASEYLLGCDPLDKRDVHNANPEDLLFIQLSSGSTGAPKCIQESHKSVIQHIMLSSEANAYSSNDRTLNWLAMDHVVPILTFHLKDTLLGCNQHIVEREVVLRDPFQWLELMSEYRITHSWSPNFGYAAVVHRLSDLAKTDFPGIDLSCVKILINAGEMVTPKAVAEFVRLTQQLGLNPSVIQPSFGMAETATCFTYPRGIDYLNSHNWLHQYSGNTFVDLGPPMRGVQIRICNATSGEVLPDGEIGELEISGPMVTKGYLFNETANEKLFHGSFLRSGDSGFIKDGCLVLTGRIKEEITIRGNKLFCHEVEEAIGHIDGVKPTYVACCGVTCSSKGTEGMVVFLCVETGREAKHIEKEVKLFVNKRYGILPNDVVVVEERHFSKTTSGKIQRLAMKDLYVKGFLKTSQQSLHLLTKVFVPAKLRSRRLPPSQRVILVIRRANQLLSSAVVDRLNREGFKICVVNVQTSSGSTLEKFANRIKVFTAIENGTIAYEQVLANVVSFTGCVDYCVNFLCLGDSTHTELESHDLVTIANGNQQLFELLNTLVEVCKAPVKFVNVTDNVDKDPYKSFSAVLQSVMVKENDLLSAVDVQVTVPLNQMQDLPPVVDFVFSEIFSLEKNEVVVYRNGLRHVLRFQEYKSEKIQIKAIKTEGTYIVSGGFGEVAQQLILCLHSCYQAKVIVISRRKFDESNVQACYRSLHQDGVDILYISGDIGCSDTFQNLLKQARSKWPTITSIDGAFHLASNYDEENVRQLTTEAINLSVRGKVLGAVRLSKFLAEQRSETILVLFSSVYASIPLKNLLTYSSANAFLEGFCNCAQQKQSNQHVVCFNWSLWKDLGISKNHPVNSRASHLGLQRINPDEGLRIMNDNLAATQPLYVGLEPGGRLVKPSMGFSDRKHLSDIAIKIQINMTPGTALPRRLDVLRKFDESIITDVVGNVLHSEDVVIGIGFRDVVALDVTDSPSLPSFVTQIKNTITKEWCNILNISTNSLASENFFEMGGESIDIPNLVSQLRNVMEVEISAADIYQNQTISGLTEYLLSIKSETIPSPLSKQKQTVWLQAKSPLQPKNPVKAILFCFPYIGSTYSCFSGWTFPDVETWFTIYPYQPHSWKQLIQTLTAGIVDVIESAPQTPFILFGHSLAALLVYEVYQYLREKGHRSPSLMIVSGMHSPLRMELRRSSVQKWNKDIETDENFLKSMSKAGFEIDDILLDRASTNTATDELIGQIRYLFHLYEIYEYRLTNYLLDIPVTVLGSRDDTFVTLDELEMWKDVCSEPINIIRFPGAHFFLYYANSLVFARIINCIFDILGI